MRIRTVSEDKGELVIAGTRTGQAVKLDITRPAMIGICGASGTGKSCLLLNLVALMRRRMLGRVQFVAFDPKLTSLYPVRGLLSKPAVVEPSEFQSELNLILQVMEKRLVAMSELGKTNLSPVGDGDEFPMIVVVFEECLSFLHNPELDPQISRDLSERMVSYCTRCRAANMGFIVCSHDFADGTTGIPKQVRSSCRTRFLFRNGINEVTTFSEKMPERCPSYNITQVGLFYYEDDNLNKWVKAITEYKPDSFYEDFSDRYKTYNRDIDPAFSVSGLFD